MFAAQPPRSRPPITPMSVVPLTQGAPLVPSTSPSHAKAGNPLSVTDVLAWHPMGEPPTPAGYPSTVTRLPGGGVTPSVSARPARDSTGAPASLLTRAIA
jgi:hypothetical protein